MFNGRHVWSLHCRYVLNDPSSASDGGANSQTNQQTSHSLATEEEEEEAGGAANGGRDRREEDLQMFWSYVVNMLINLESLSAERIFQMLKMFAMHGGGAGGSGSIDADGGGTDRASECTLDVVRQFLDKKVRERELVFQGGQYRLSKN